MKVLHGLPRYELPGQAHQDHTGLLQLRRAYREQQRGRDQILADLQPRTVAFALAMLLMQI